MMPSHDAGVLVTLDRAAGPAFEAMTFPRFRALLHDLGDMHVAVGALLAGEPVGLALASLRESTDEAEVLSLFVVAEQRGRGFGTRLLTHLQRELARRCCGSATVSYAADKPSVPALERVLRSCGWETPWPRMYICQSDRRILEAPIAQRRVEAPFSIVPWHTVSARDRAAINARQASAGWFPVVLDPFADEMNIASNSFALRHEEAVAGWIITHAVAPDTIRYSSVFVDPRLRNRGLGAALFGEALRSHDWDAVPKAIGAIDRSNITMIDIMRRELAPYLVRLSETRGSSRSLAAGAE